jgi:hypothetical protein
MPAAVRIIALTAVAVAVCCCALLFAASIPIELLEAPAHAAPTGKVNFSLSHNAARVLSMTPFDSMQFFLFCFFDDT